MVEWGARRLVAPGDWLMISAADGGALALSARRPTKVAAVALANKSRPHRMGRDDARRSLSSQEEIAQPA